MRRYVVAPAARRDLAELARYYRSSAGKPVAQRMIFRILGKCRLIAETPGTIGQRRDEIGPDLRSFPVPPHVVYFRFSAGFVEIVRILHGRRDVRPDLF